MEAGEQWRRSSFLVHHGGAVDSHDLCFYHPRLKIIPRGTNSFVLGWKCVPPGRERGRDLGLHTSTFFNWYLFHDRYGCIVQHPTVFFSSTSDIKMLGTSGTYINADFDLKNFAEAQQNDKQTACSKMRYTSLQLRKSLLPNGWSIHCDGSVGSMSHLIPWDMHRGVFSMVNCASHLDIRATQGPVTQQYIWLSTNKDVHRWTKTCSACQS